MNKKLYIVHTNSILELYYTLYPFIVSKTASNSVEFVHFNSKKFKKITGKNILFTRIFKGKFNNLEFVQGTINEIKTRFDNVIFLDDSAGADSTHFEIIDSIDIYFKAKLLINHETYHKKIYGRQIFSDFYHTKFGIKDSKEKIRQPILNAKSLDKLKLAFNLGYGFYPKPPPRSLKRIYGYLLARGNIFKNMKPFFVENHEKIIKKLSSKVNFSSKELAISSRFRHKNLPKTIGYQRKIFENLVINDSRFKTGIISPDLYEKELQSVLATLSPFGFGEVCVRDFECVLNGSILIKPDMSHMKTFPNIYYPNETYIPIKWDGSDLIEKIDHMFTNPKEHHEKVIYAREIYRKNLQNIDEHVVKLYGELF
ncbi:MAG: hypothetical protein EA391_00925 [Balneolaceae bacterium]|nr:MAG: hypothetical protein EA391_00925 [Balneolaceae bacterium]